MVNYNKLGFNITKTVYLSYFIQLPYVIDPIMCTIIKNCIKKVAKYNKNGFKHNILYV